jgi:hypothetical protein
MTAEHRPRRSRVETTRPPTEAAYQGQVKSATEVKNTEDPTTATTKLIGIDLRLMESCPRKIGPPPRQ